VSSRAESAARYDINVPGTKRMNRASRNHRYQFLAGPTRPANATPNLLIRSTLIACYICAAKGNDGIFPR
jgi:hypothetical protein